MNINLNAAPGGAVQSTARTRTEKTQEAESSARAPRRLSDQIFISSEGREAA